MRDNEQFLWRIISLLLTLTALFLAISWWGGSNMVGFIPPFVAQFAAIVCASLALIIMLILFVKNIIGSRKRGGKEITSSGFNITIDSRDFISMDIKRIKAVFDGLEKITKHKEKNNKETKRDSKT